MLCSSQLNFLTSYRIDGVKLDCYVKFSYICIPNQLALTLMIPDSKNPLNKPKYSVTLSCIFCLLEVSTLHLPKHSIDIGIINQHGFKPILLL